VLAKSDLDELTNQHPALARALSQGIATRLSGSGSEINDERFRKFTLLADLNPSDLRQVLERLHPTRFRAGEQIYRVNTPADTLYLLEKGQVRVQPLSGLTWSLGAGETFGERALLSNQPHNTSVVAETDVDVWALNKKDFEMLMARYPSLAINLSRMLSQRMVQTPANDVLPLEMEEPVAPVRRRQVAAMHEPEARMERPGFADWYAGLSRGAKLRFGLLILLILFLLGVVVPMTLWTLLYGVPPAARSFSQALAAVYSMGSYELAAADRERARVIALVDRQAPQTPTYTPPPTNTPIPTPTFIPTSAFAQGPTSEPVFIPASAQQQPVVQDALPPTPEPAVQAAVAARAWDGRLDQLGVTIEEAQVSPGQQYWRLIEGRWADEAESAGKHHIYVEVLDENGNRVVGQPVTVWWGDGFNSGPIEDKTPPDFGYNFQMYASGFAYNTKVEGMPSDTVKGAGMGSIDQRFYGIHTSFYFVFQRATK
jgi:CRP-like cAMP-binding protein